MCDSGLSVGGSETAMPPCAYCVLLSRTLLLVITATAPCLARCRAVQSPAMPEPMIAYRHRMVSVGSLGASIWFS